MAGREQRGSGLVSPYDAPGFYETALARGRHRDVVGGRWDETGRAQMAVLTGAGMTPESHLLDIGAGSLRLGCRAVPFLLPGHYWATDRSAALMRRGHEAELGATDRLPPSHLVEDADFAFPGVPPVITHAMAFAVFTHLPIDRLSLALGRVAAAFPVLEVLLFTVFLAPEPLEGAALRQPDGVVTHPDRPPYHFRDSWVMASCAAAGLPAKRSALRLPRGQVMFEARRG